jgi:hypothetical protein
MAKIYGREADIEKVRSDEKALRDAMRDFVAAHNFTDREQFGKFGRAPQQQPASEASTPAVSVEPKRKAEAA